MGWEKTEGRWDRLPSWEREKPSRHPRLSLSPENLAKFAFKSLWRSSEGHAVLVPEALGPSWPQKERTTDIMCEHTQLDSHENCPHVWQSLGYFPARARTACPLYLFQDRWERDTYCLKRKERPAQFNLLPHHIMLTWATRTEARAAVSRAGLYGASICCQNQRRRCCPNSNKPINKTGQRLIITCPNSTQPQRATVWLPSLTHSCLLRPLPGWPIHYHLYHELIYTEPTGSL